MRINPIKTYNFYNQSLFSYNAQPVQTVDKSITNSKNKPIPALHRGNIIYFTSNINTSTINPYKKYDLNNKNILITGGTGTIGNQVLESLLSDYNPKSITVFSRDEMKQHTMKLKYKNNPNIKFVIGDVRSQESLEKSFKNIDVVIHTAAMKHVPICEDNPEEAVKTNIDGVRNIINAALNSNVKRVLAVSSDKAAAPTNIYGATKFVGEKLLIDANKYTDDDGVKFSCVRLGNVLGSRGSIIPLFKEQSKSGNIKITDENMTRFFMTPKQATSLILTGIESMNGGEIFIPKLKNTSIVNLAKKIAPDTKQEFIGARPGEKLSEDFITFAENANTIEINDKYVILPKEQATRSQELWIGSKKVAPDFDYSSGNVQFQMTGKELSELVEQFI